MTETGILWFLVIYLLGLAVNFYSFHFIHKQMDYGPDFDNFYMGFSFASWFFTFCMVIAYLNWWAWKKFEDRNKHNKK